MKTIGKNKPLAVIFWLMSAAVAFVIFKFSCDTAEESSELSESLLAVIIEFIGRYISHNLLRKIAHFCEFAALGFFVGGAVKFTFDKTKVYFPLPICVLYSISDEIHQYFVPGRACRLFDVFVDTCGSLTGILVFLLLIFIILKIINRKDKNTKGDGNHEFQK